MRYTARDMIDKGMTPLDVYDANGMRICRKITMFDMETGEVESFVCGPNGRILLNEDGEGERRLETYPAPLTWKTISTSEMERSRSELWDLRGK